jgi:hypothetical protein
VYTAQHALTGLWQQSAVFHRVLRHLFSRSPWRHSSRLGNQEVVRSTGRILVASRRHRVSQRQQEIGQVGFACWLKREPLSSGLRCSGPSQSILTFFIKEKGKVAQAPGYGVPRQPKLECC